MPPKACHYETFREGHKRSGLSQPLRRGVSASADRYEVESMKGPAECRMLVRVATLLIGEYWKKYACKLCFQASDVGGVLV